MTVYLIRHANAGARGAFSNDLERPLDEIGRAQADAIGERLADAGIERVLASAAIRCIQTVEPLARRVGVSTEADPSLMEGQTATPAVALIHRLATDGVTAALCSHGDIIPGALRRLEQMGIPLNGSSCAKGSIWEVSVVDGRIGTATYHALTRG